MKDIKMNDVKKKYEDLSNLSEDDIKWIAELKDEFNNKISIVKKETNQFIQNEKKNFYSIMVVLLTAVLSVSPFLNLSDYLEENLFLSSKLTFPLIMVILIIIIIKLKINHDKNIKNQINSCNKFIKEDWKHYSAFIDGIVYRSKLKNNLK